MDIFCKKNGFFMKRWHPRFCTPLQRFGLIFRVWDLRGGFKKQEKTAPGKSCFFGLKRKFPKSVFYDFRVSFGVDFGALGRPKMVQLIFWFFFGVRRPPWTILGPLLAPFWGHFRVILGLLLKCFGVFSVMFPSLGSRWFFLRIF